MQPEPELKSLPSAAAKVSIDNETEMRHDATDCRPVSQPVRSPVGPWARLLWSVLPLAETRTYNPFGK